MVAFHGLLALAVASVSLFNGAVAQNLVVTGSTSGGTQPRLEIRQLQRNAPMWNLFLLSMESFMATSQNNEASYFQIAGIHGAPYITWDGVGPAPGQSGGYCPHMNNLFGPWHRPYLALFEQRLSVHARRIAQQFPPAQRERNVRAARNMRLPYWDWVRSGDPIMPESMTRPTIQVQRPNGRREDIPNPLSRYRFHPVDPRLGNGSPETRRGSSIEGALQAGRNGNRQTVYRILAEGGQYNQISNWRPGSSSINFEAAHNNIHGQFGSGSHMTNPSIAAFDPAFWLHHANVDRLLAIWQRLHPESYVTPTRYMGSTFTIPNDSLQGADSRLAPFHSNQGDQFWTSASARNTESLRYTYPELRDGPSEATLRARVTRLYGSAPGISRTAARKVKRDIDEDLKTVPDVDIVLNVTSGDTVFQYTAEVDMPRTVNGESYNFLLFLGEPGDDASQWLSNANLVDMQSTFSGAMAGGADDILPATIFLTDAILEKFAAGELDGLDRDTVVDYLTATLQWRVEQGGQSVPQESVPIEVRLASQAVLLPETEEAFPEFQESNSIAPINATIMV